MKKLLYTLLVGLLVISCNKDEMGSGVAPLVLDQEVEEVSIDASGLIDRLIATTKGNESKSITSKDAIAGTSYITVYTSIIDGVLYEIAFDDTQKFCDDDITLSKFTLFFNSSRQSELKLGDVDANTLVTIEDDLGFLYGLDINQGVKVNADGSFESATASDNVFTF